MGIKTDNYAVVAVGTHKRRKFVHVFFRNGAAEEQAEETMLYELRRLVGITDVQDTIENIIEREWDENARVQRVRVTLWREADGKLAGRFPTMIGAYADDKSIAEELGSIPVDEIELRDDVAAWLLRCAQGPRISHGEVKAGRLVSLGLVRKSQRFTGGPHKGENEYAITERGKVWVALHKAVA